MKISIIVQGRWNTFDLARELHKTGQLGQLITPYPRYFVRRYGVPTESIVSLPWIEAARRASSRFPRKLVQSFQIALISLFSRQAALLLRPCDIVDAWGDVATPAFRKAARWSCLCACESASAHILEQERLLQEEHKRFNLHWQPTHPTIISRRLADYDNADVIVCTSNFIKQSFLARGFADEKLIVVPYGVDLGKFTPVSTPPDRFRVGFVGGLSLRKGVLDLVSAYLSARLPNAELCLLGHIEDNLDALLPSNVPSVKRLGHIPHAKIAQHIQQFSVLVVPSIEDGFAMVVTEALACGVPVICSANTGGKEVLGNDGIQLADEITQHSAGFVVPIRRPDCIEKCLHLLYDSASLRQSMREAALAIAGNGIDWSDYAQRWSNRLAAAKTLNMSLAQNPA